MTSSEMVAVIGFGLNVWASAQIWFAQVVVYPLFLRVGARDYLAFHRFYSRRIPLPVIVPGFACFFSPLLLAAFGPALPMNLTMANIALGLIGLGVTVGLEIPRHAALERRGRDERVIAELIRYNWPRTASISLQAAIGLAIMNRAIGHGG